MRRREIGRCVPPLFAQPRIKEIGFFLINKDGYRSQRPQGITASTCFERLLSWPFKLTAVAT